jgi:hypothetical protein
MSNTTIFLLSASFAFSVVYLMSKQSLDEQAVEHKSYCELVSMWEEDAEQGIEPVNRDGMPNYKGLECE